MKTFSSVLITLISTIVLLASIFFIVRQDDVIDWWLLREYDPPAEIAALSENTTMTDLGERYFYVYQPMLLDRDTFRQACTIAEKSIVLGCYVSRQGIFIYDVTDEQLAGIREVTAAHEMLHVAYERLSADERERIDALNLQAYDELDNERIRRTIQAYRDRDPQIAANELHSILPTEVRNLNNPELEEYYAQYFDNRLAVVEFSEQYASVFEAARERVEQLDSQLKQQREEIEVLQNTLDNQAASLEAERARLNQLFEAEDFAAYNDGVESFNAGVRLYNDTVNRLQSLISDYNDLVAERNNAAVSYESLTTSIDTRPPAPIDPLN